MKLASFPLELLWPSLYFGRLTRETRMLLYCIAAPAGRAQATSLVRRQNLISKSHSRTLARRFNSRSPVQPAVILESTDWHERLGVREHTRPACRFDQLSSARASMAHRRNEVRFLPARASQASSSEGLHARRVCSVTLSRHQLGVRRCPHSQAEPHLQKSFQSAAKALQ